MAFIAALTICTALTAGCSSKNESSSESAATVQTTADTISESAEGDDIDLEAYMAALDSGLDPENDADAVPIEDEDDMSRANPAGNGNSRHTEYTKISPNRSSPRNHKIDTITIHCMAGQLSVETCGNVFASSKAQASSNYGVGKDGRIAMYVEEKDRSWCSSNRENDNRAVTIEVASDSYAPYAVSDAAYNATIKLVADICKRNGIKKLVWSNDKNERVNHLNGANMTVHRDFANKACPGDYLYSRMGDIAEKVNAILDKENK